MKAEVLLAAGPGGPVRAGTIDDEDGAPSFRYAEGYLADEHACPLSRALPLRPKPFPADETAAYFEGLLPNGKARMALAETLGISSRSYLYLLGRCGRECIGDVMFSEASGPVLPESGYEPIGEEELRAIFQDAGSIAEENAGRQMLIPGAQPKCALARLDRSAKGTAGWFRPFGLAASTHILKASSLPHVPEVEYFCMKAAGACDIKVPAVELLDCGKTVLAVESFDRKRREEGESVLIERLHQEDLAQALGVLPSMKYEELASGSVRQIAELIRAHSADPIADLNKFASMLVFNYAIGNCDAHLKNYSFLLDSQGMRLAPAYGLVSTTCFDRFSRNLAMDFGGMRDIDEVGPEQLRGMAKDLSISVKALKRIAGHIAETLVPGIQSAFEGDGWMPESLPFAAEGLMDEMAPRLAVLRRFAA
jgi:serine/threonine-protein kinase HipA